MNELQLADNIIIDFDSTIVKVEALDELARIVLDRKSEAQVIQDKIRAITKLGMEGKISFRDSLISRLKLLEFDKTAIHKLNVFLIQNISESFLKEKINLKQYRAKIYIISGGFRDWVIPVCEFLQLELKNVFCNEFIFDKSNKVVGFDLLNPLSDKAGKINVIKNLALRGRTIVIGDGYTDYEIRLQGLASKFYKFCEVIKRDFEISQDDQEIMSLSQII